MFAIHEFLRKHTCVTSSVEEHLSEHQRVHVYKHLIICCIVTVPVYVTFLRSYMSGI